MMAGEDWICRSCVYYPPSSCDGKPCCVCEPDDELLNCYQEREDLESDKGRNEPQWFHIWERLPDEDMREYLVLIKSDTNPPEYTTDILRYNKKRRAFYDLDWERGEFARKDVKYWMPIPEIPE